MILQARRVQCWTWVVFCIHEKRGRPRQIDETRLAKDAKLLEMTSSACRTGRGMHRRQCLHSGNMHAVSQNYHVNLSRASEATLHHSNPPQVQNVRSHHAIWGHHGVDSRRTLLLTTCTPSLGRFAIHTCPVEAVANAATSRARRILALTR